MIEDTYRDETEELVFEAFRSWLAVLGMFEPWKIRNKKDEDIWRSFCDSIKDEYYKNSKVEERVIDAIEEMKVELGEVNDEGR